MFLTHTFFPGAYGHSVLEGGTYREGGSGMGVCANRTDQIISLVRE
jgi:hypothetical protein